MYVNRIRSGRVMDAVERSEASRCRQCGGPWHPASGAVYGGVWCLCGRCEREFQVWVRGRLRWLHSLERPHAPGRSRSRLRSATPGTHHASNVDKEGYTMPNEKNDQQQQPKQPQNQPPQNQPDTQAVPQAPMPPKPEDPKPVKDDENKK